MRRASAWIAAKFGWLRRRLRRVPAPLTTGSVAHGAPRFYVYVSATKVDMLRAQVPSTVQEKIAAELKIDLKLVSATLKERSNPESLYHALRVVETYLDREGLIGTLANPGPYVRAVMPMRWSPLQTAGTHAMYFTGEQDGVVVGLGGSWKHMIGGAPVSTSDAPVRDTSEFYALVSGLSDALIEEGATTEHVARRNFRTIPLPPLAAVVFAARRLQGIDRRVEFVAKTLLHGPFRKKRSILGSPLYVALVDEPPASAATPPEVSAATS